MNQSFASGHAKLPNYFPTLNRNAVAPSSPGLAASATLGLQIKNHSTAKRLCHFLDESKTAATALRLGSHKDPRTQGSRGGQPWAGGRNRVAVRPPAKGRHASNL